jgi:hypothetical protein
MMESTFPDPTVQGLLADKEFEVLSHDDSLVAEEYEKYSTGGFPLTIFLNAEEEVLHQKIGLIRPGAFVQLWEEIELNQNLAHYQRQFEEGASERGFLWKYLLTKEQADILTKQDIRESWKRWKESPERTDGENLVFAAEWMMLDYVFPVWDITEEPMVSLVRNLDEARKLYPDTVLDGRMTFYALMQVNKGLDSTYPGILKPAYFLLESLEPDWLLLNYTDSGDLIAGVKLAYPVEYLGIEVANKLGDKEMQLRYEEKLFSELSEDPEWMYEYMQEAVISREIDQDFARRCLNAWRESIAGLDKPSADFHLMTAELALKTHRTILAAESLEHALELSNPSDSSYNEIQSRLSELQD